MSKQEFSDDFDPMNPARRPVEDDDRRAAKREVQSGHVDNLAAQQLRNYIERIERLEEEKAEIGDDIKDVYGDLKGAGFDPKTVRAIVRMRKEDPAERAERQAVLDTYLEALGMAGGG